MSRVEQLKRISAAADALGKLGDQTNIALKMFEEDVFQAGAAARVFIRLTDETMWSVGWSKFQQEWKLVAVRDGDDPVALLSAPLRVRLEALRRADEIMNEIAMAMESIIATHGGK